MSEVKNYIAGQFADPGDGCVDVYNPATGEVIAQMAEASGAQILEALEAARDAFSVWSGMSIDERKACLLRFAEALEAAREKIVGLLVEETGKTRDVAEYDFDMLVDCIRFYIEEVKRFRTEVIPDYTGGHFNFTEPDPVGVVAGLLTWNFPLLNLGYKLGPMLASGCTGVFKVAKQTPLASMEVARVFDRCGFPKGTLSLLSGDGKLVSDTIASSTIPRLLTMIGSTFAGKKLIEKSPTSIKRFSLELGGNAPILVFPDCDLDHAVADVTGLKVANAGQICVAPNRVYVHRDVYDAFVAKAVEALKAYTPENPDAQLSPVVSSDSLERLLNLLKPEAHGGTVMCGGAALDRPGWFLAPTLVKDCARDSELMADEIFGPILAVTPFDDSDDPWALANDTDMGLSAYVYTGSLDTAMAARKNLMYGNILINEAFYSVHLPHGGVKQSGVGKDIGHHCLADYFEIKRVSIRMP